MQFIASKIAIIEKCGSGNAQGPCATNPLEEVDLAAIAARARRKDPCARNDRERAAPLRGTHDDTHTACRGHGDARAQDTTPRAALQCAHRRGGPPLDFPPGTTTLLFQYGRRTGHAPVAHGPFAGTHGRTIAVRSGTTTTTNTHGDDSC